LSLACKEWMDASAAEIMALSNEMHACRLKDKGRTFREAFLAKLALLLRGTVAAPPERFGETLADEHIRGGARPALLRGRAPWARGSACSEAGSAQ